METVRKIKDIFKDFTKGGKILEANIEAINLFKKSNQLELKLMAEEMMPISEIYALEEYLKARFLIAKVTIQMVYSFEVDVPEQLEENWQNIICYMSKRFPLSKELLKRSTLEITENQIHVKLPMQGKDILYAMHFDKELADLVFDLYGRKYRIIYEEQISSQQKEENEKILEEEQKRAIQLVQTQISAGKQDGQQEKTKSPAPKETNKVEAQTVTQEASKANVEEKTPLIYGKISKVKADFMKVIDISTDTEKIAIEGEVIGIDSRELKNGKILISFKLYDGSSTIVCKTFVTAQQSDKILSRIKEAKGIRVEGNAKYDPFTKEMGVIANTIIETEGMKKEKRMDHSEQKRVELHMHTQMSQMDGMTACADLLKRAVSWGMKSIAITDHGVVQAFPDAHKYLGKSKADIKVIYGVEAYLVPDKEACVAFPKGQDIHTTYCVLDIETTGLSFRTEKITEIGIMKYQDGEVIDRFECFVNPEKPIPEEVVNITHITDDMVKDAETIDQVLPKVIEFVGDSILVAHNADFDIGFIKYNCSLLGLKLNNTYLDTLRLAKELFPDYKKYKLGMIAENLGIKVEVAHRALDDVDTLVKVFRVMLAMLEEKGVQTVEDIDKLETGKADYKKLPSYHAIILAKDYIGLRNLYKLISISHLHYFYKKPRILKSIYKKYSEGLILGSACEAGELYRAIVAGKTDEEIEKIASDYDYLEIQPIGNNMHMVRNATVPDEEALRDINRKIVAIGEKLRKISSSNM